eukprot:358984-Chlamydomonas_euryale.AAC.8
MGKANGGTFQSCSGWPYPTDLVARDPNSGSRACLRKAGLERGYEKPCSLGISKSPSDWTYH